MAGGRDKVPLIVKARRETAGIVRDRPPDDGTGIDSIVTCRHEPSESRSPSPRRRSPSSDEHPVDAALVSRYVLFVELALPLFVAARQTPGRSS